jgi:hypothetical protein
MSSRGKRPSGVRLSILALLAVLLPALSLAAPIKTQGTWYGSNGWDGTLRGRDAAGNPINLLNATADAPNPDLKYVYDTQLNLTWLADWNAGAGSVFDDGPSGTDGAMTWSAANAWSASLTDGGGGWALPGVVDVGADGCNFDYSGTDCGYNVYGSESGRRVSALAHAYYDSLGNLALYDKAGAVQVPWGMLNTGPFRNVQSFVYWTASAYGPSTSDTAWAFNTLVGQHSTAFKVPPHVAGLFAVAVMQGDVWTGSGGDAVAEPRDLSLWIISVGAFLTARCRRLSRSA